MSNMISIIVPVYNAEIYIRDTVASLLNQTYNNIEIILVDDGSKDRSLSICEELKEKDNRIRVYSKKNSGVSSTRNFGIKVSNGDYIMFCDSDDVVSENWCEILLLNYKNDSLVLSSYCICDKNKQKNVVANMINNESGIYDVSEFYPFFNCFLLNSICNKIYSSRLIKKINLLFDEELSNGEDLIFNLNYLDQCEKINYINMPLYYYNRMNNLSLTHQAKMDLFVNYFSVLDEIEKRFVEYNSQINDIVDIIQFDYGKIIWDILLQSISINVKQVKNVKKKVLSNNRYFKGLVKYTEKIGINCIYSALIKKKMFVTLYYIVKLRKKF